MAPKTSDGYLWTPEKGIQHGAIETDAVVSPQRSISGWEGKVYDAIVIGAGYAGLSAACDLCGSSMSVSRPRIFDFTVNSGGNRTFRVAPRGSGSNRWEDIHGQQRWCVASLLAELS